MWKGGGAEWRGKSLAIRRDWNQPEIEQQPEDLKASFREQYSSLKSIWSEIACPLAYASQKSSPQLLSKNHLLGPMPMVLLTKPLWEPFEEGFIIVVPTLQMRKLRLREAHAAGQGWNQDCTSVPSFWPRCSTVGPGTCLNSYFKEGLTMGANFWCWQCIFSRRICITRMLGCLWPLRASKGVWHHQSQTMALCELVPLP